MRHRAWALLLLVPATLLALTVLRSPFPTFHQHLSLAGTPTRFVATVVRAGRADARGALWLDNVFVVSFLLVVPRLLRTGLERWAPERRHQYGWWYLAPRVAVLAGSLDLVENVVALSLVGRQRPATALTLLVATVCWAKWVAYTATVIAVAGLVVGPTTAGRRSRRRVAPPAPAPAMPPDGNAAPGRTAVVLAAHGRGTGERVAAVLQRWDGAPGGPFLERTPWAVATGTAAVALAPRPSRERRLAVLRWVAFAAGVVLAAAGVGSLAGHAVRTRALHAWFPAASAALDGRLGWRDLAPLRLVVPPAAWIVTALVAAGVAAARDGAAADRAVAIARRCARAGAALAVVTLGMPAVVRFAPDAAGALDLGRVPGGALLAAVGVGAVLAGVQTRRHRLAGAGAAALLVIVAIGAADAVAWQRGGVWASLPVPGTGWRVDWALLGLLWWVVLDRTLLAGAARSAPAPARPWTLRLGPARWAGAWMPRPRVAGWFTGPDIAPRPHLGRQLAALAGRGEAAGATFVAIGGPRSADRLGVVVALAERPDTLAVLDVSPADMARAALDDALALAGRELGVTSQLVAGAREADGSCVAAGTVSYPDGTSCHLVHGTLTTLDRSAAAALADRIADRIAGQFEQVTA